MPELSLTLFNDIASRKLVVSQTSRQEFTFPSPFHQDYISIKFFAVKLGKSSNEINAAYEVVDLSATTVTITIFLASAPTTELSAQAAYVYNGTDGSRNGYMNLDTTAMRTAFTNASTTTLAAILEIELDDTAGRLTTFQTPLTIRREYITHDTTPATTGVVYLTEAQCNARFAKAIGDAGASITLTSADGAKQTVLYTHNDGSFHSDPI